MGLRKSRRRRKTPPPDICPKCCHCPTNKFTTGCAKAARATLRFVKGFMPLKKGYCCVRLLRSLFVIVGVNMVTAAVTVMTALPPFMNHGKEHHEYIIVVLNLLVLFPTSFIPYAVSKIRSTRGEHVSKIVIPALMLCYLFRAFFQCCFIPEALTLHGQTLVVVIACVTGNTTKYCRYEWCDRSLYNLLFIAIDLYHSLILLSVVYALDFRHFHMVEFDWLTCFLILYTASDQQL